MKPRKGQIYSLIVIVIVVTMVPFFIAYMEQTQSSRSGMAEKIIADQLRQSARFIERDIEKALEISAKRALFSAINHVVTNGSYLDNSTLRLMELTENGTLYGGESMLMHNNTMPDWIEKVLSVDTAFNTHLNYSGLAIENCDGFNIKVSAVLMLNMSDSMGIARIDKAEQKTMNVSIINMEDPAFPMNSNGFVTRLITRCLWPEPAVKNAGTVSHGNCTGNTTFDINAPAPSAKIFVNQSATASDARLDAFAGVILESPIDLTAEVVCHVSGVAGAAGFQDNTSFYIDENTKAAWRLYIKDGLDSGCYYPGNGPDLLRLLEGDLSETAGKGLETFVNVPEMEAVGIQANTTQSMIEHLYFNGVHAGCMVRGMPEWFRIDNAGIARYNLTGLAYGNC